MPDWVPGYMPVVCGRTQHVMIALCSTPYLDTMGQIYATCIGTIEIRGDCCI